MTNGRPPRSIADLLEEWAHDSAADQPAVHIIGRQHSARAQELRDVLARNGIPFQFYPADSDRGRALLQQSGHAGAALPVVITYTGQALPNPSTDEVAAAFGLRTLPAGTVDVAIVGAGPAGLSAAVYCASEGLSTLLIEREAIGGQAGSSSLIRNYLGFPRGVTGRSLATRGFAQVWAFGAAILVSRVIGLRPITSGYALSLVDGAEIHCRCALVATGVSY